MLLHRLFPALILITAALPARAKKPRLPAQPPPLRTLGITLVRALDQGKFSIAKHLVPTQKELKAMGISLTRTEYQRFLRKRRAGFAKVHAKFLKKRKLLRAQKITCRHFVFSRIKAGKTVRRGRSSIIKTADVFARCGSREVWVADPDGIFRAASGWKLMEFD